MGLDRQPRHPKARSHRVVVGSVRHSRENDHFGGRQNEVERRSVLHGASPGFAQGGAAIATPVEQVEYGGGQALERVDGKIEVGIRGFRSQSQATPLSKRIGDQQASTRVAKCGDPFDEIESVDVDRMLIDDDEGRRAGGERLKRGSTRRKARRASDTRDGCERLTEHIPDEACAADNDGIERYPFQRRHTRTDADTGRFNYPI